MRAAFEQSPENSTYGLNYKRKQDHKSNFVKNLKLN